MTDTYVTNDEDYVDDGSESQTTSTKHMLTKVRISNFKRIKEAELEIGPVTYIVGGNNSGKSSAIQAIHTAVTAAQVGRKRQQQVIPTSSLRYSPAADFESIGHGRLLENKADGLRAVVEFMSQTDNPTEDSRYRVEIYRGRNFDSIGVDREPKQGRLADRIQDSRKLFSIYTPGLSGIPLREEYMSYASVFQRAAGGEANLVFRNILRLIAERNKLDELENAISNLIGEEISIYIGADEEQDFYITVEAAIGDEYHYVPVELWGTGLLQITQLYSYVILFRPAVLLADEPDAHLHPSRQKLLGDAFRNIAENYNCQVIATTHSEHLISSRPENTKLIWMRDGKSETYEREELIPLLMHLGCLDSINPYEDQTIILTEDEKTEYLETAIMSLDDKGRNITIIPSYGVGNLIVGKMFARLKEAFPSKMRIIIHRDRDFLTDPEIEAWKKQKFDENVDKFDYFITRYSDIEGYYCSLEHLAQALGDSERLRRNYSSFLAGFKLQAREQFAKKREAANSSGFYPSGGSPRNDELWPAETRVSLDYVVGKHFLAYLCHKFSKRHLDFDAVIKSAPKQLVADLQALLIQDQA